MGGSVTTGWSEPLPSSNISSREASMAKLFIEDLNVAGKRVLMRVDYNVPLKDGKVEDDKRIAASLPSIKYVLDKGGSVVLMSHLGRPDGKVVNEFCLKPVAHKL